MSHHVFASMRARDWIEPARRLIFLRYELIESIQEIRSVKGPIGFVDMTEVRRQIEGETKDD